MTLPLFCLDRVPDSENDFFLGTPKKSPVFYIGIED